MIPVLRLVASLVRLSTAPAIRRIAVVSGLPGLALLLALIGFTGFAAALWIWLARLLDPVAVARIIAGAGFVIAAILLLVASRQRRAPGLLSSPEAQQVLADLKPGQGPITLRAPRIGPALLGFPLGRKSKDQRRGPR